MAGAQVPMYVQPGMHATPPMYAHNPEDALLQYGPQLASSHHPHSVDTNMGIPQQDMGAQSHPGFSDMPQYQMAYPNSMPYAQMPAQPMQHMRHPSEHFAESPAPDDSNTENGGARRRRTAASSAANDQELRRLLAQYEGKALKDISIEIRRSEGEGGKSEKLKQVFAMLW